jgi:predicted enzyme related to lactoylglutathione lyase
MSTETTKTQASNFVWYELHTSDVEAAKAFYSVVLGWGTQDAGMPGHPYTLITVDKLPIGGILEKPAKSMASGAQSGWMGYIGVDDVDAYSKRVEQAGGVVHRAAEKIPGVGSFAVVADPQGAIFVLFEPANGGQQPERPAPGTPGSAAWHDLAAIDWKSDFTFYADLFGWTKADAMDMGSSGIYQIFACGGVSIGGMMTRMNPAQSPGWLYYFNVATIQAAMDQVKQHGGTIVHGPSVVPGGQQIAHCLDPQGAIFGIVSPS